MKKLFKNYNFNFDKNEKKILLNFCKQALKQFAGNEQYYKEANVFNSIIEKLNQPGETKFTKDERTRLELQLRNNYKFIKDKANKSKFIMKWIYNSLSKQYSSILETHFND